MPDVPRGPAARLQRLGNAVENAALVALLGAMMLLAVTQIALRLFFSTGFVWADELLKLIVLWIALIASVAASGNRRHLRIDILSHFVPVRLARLPMVVAEGFAAGICGLLTYQSWRYVSLSREFGDTVLVGIPAWIAYGILPLGCALMTWRFLVSALVEAALLLRPHKGEEPQSASGSSSGPASQPRSGRADGDDA